MKISCIQTEENMKALKILYQSQAFENEYTYEGCDLGAIWTREETTFTLWSPAAQAVWLLLFKDGSCKDWYLRIPMTKGPQGTWKSRVKGDLHGVYYNYELHIDQDTVISGDPYARACGVNGRRSMVIDLSRTNPRGWELDRPVSTLTENVIYELHVKEFSWDPSGGFPEQFRGKYKAFTCAHTTLNHDGIHPTGMDYLKNLGVTHIQLMPVYDYGSVDEAGDPDEFNWGYDPVNYNVPEGSYATDAADGQVRIREFKEMIQALHQNGFRVIMDVVYNHTFSLESSLQKTMPWYYYRVWEDGRLSNGSACGNDVASERKMCSKYILESVMYWAREYHIDGFRFDLMGLLNVDLMNTIRAELDQAFGKGEKLVFGEPWSAAQTPMEKGQLPALKKYIDCLDENVGMFCDNTRDTIKGHVFEGTKAGFVNGIKGLEKDILKCAQAWCHTNEVKAKAPSQMITYISAHDNWTLWDKLYLSMPGKSETEIMAAYRLAAAIYMTCQGSLFMLSGEEFARTKDGLENSYNASVWINCLDWEKAWKNTSLVDYYKGLIGLRKQLPGLCDKSRTACSRFLDTWTKDQCVGYILDNCTKKGCPSRWEKIYVIYNAGEKEIDVKLPEGCWEILAEPEDSRVWERHQQAGRSVKAAPVGAVILGDLRKDRQA